MFYYFAYGSCMCPVDLKRSLGEKTRPFVIGPATLRGYRLGFYHHLLHCNCGALDIVPDPAASVEGVLYQLPWRLSDRLDEREEVYRGGYQHESVQVCCGGQQYQGVRTYTVVHKLPEELAPEDGTSTTLGLWRPGDVVGRVLSKADLYEIECLTSSRRCYCHPRSGTKLLKP